MIIWMESGEKPAKWDSFLREWCIITATIFILILESINDPEAQAVLTVDVIDRFPKSIETLWKGDP